MKRTRIYLVRHGQVEGHEQKRYNGQADVDLTPEGEAQYGLLEMRLRNKNFAAVYSSDLKRCREGARLLGSSHGLEPVLREDLRELHIGEWERKTWQELEDEYPEEWQARLENIVNYRVPGGESLREMAERVRPVIREIVDAHRGEDVLLVAHGGVNRIVLLDAIGASLDRLFHIEQDYGCFNIIDYYEDGVAVVKLLNG